MEERGNEGALTPRAAALALADARRDGAGERHVRAAVDAQIRRTGLGAHDADDVRSEVALALLLTRPDERLHPDRVCARAAAIARNKSIDVVRRQRRTRPADAVQLSDRAPSEPSGRLLGGLDAVQAEAHRRLVRPHLRAAIGDLDERERVVLAAHVAGSAHAAAGLSRSTFYRVLADTREQLQTRLAAAIAAALLAPARLLKGLGTLGGPAAAGGAAVATIAVVVVVSLPGARPPPRVELPPSESARVLPVAAPTPAATTRPGRVAAGGAREFASLPASPPVDEPAAAPSAAAASARAELPPPAPQTSGRDDVCPYDPSSYYC